MIKQLTFDFIENKIKKTNGISHIEKNGWHGFYFFHNPNNANGILFLKIQDNKIIGKSMFQQLENNWGETIFNDYGELSGENYLPPKEMIEAAIEHYPYGKNVLGWFSLKAILMCDWITKETLTVSTITTKQERIPNTGIIMGIQELIGDIYLRMEY